MRSLDQHQVAVSLACLPVYIAGCQRFVVLRGPTVLGRLWCIVELFTFLAMGGSPDAIEVVSFGDAPRLSDVRTTAPGEPLADAVRSESPGRIDLEDELFDARRASCATREDQMLLTSVIEAYPRGIDALNAELLAALRDGEQRWRMAVERGVGSPSHHASVAGSMARMRNLSGGFWGHTTEVAVKHKTAQTTRASPLALGRQTSRVAPQLPSWTRRPSSDSDLREVRGTSSAGTDISN